jgi:hypothetical protein
MRMNLGTTRGSVHGVHHMNLSGLANLGRPGLPSAFHVRRTALGMLPTGLNRGMGQEYGGSFVSPAEIASQFGTSEGVVSQFNILGVIPNNAVVQSVGPLPSGYPLPPNATDQNPADWQMVTYVGGGTAPVLNPNAGAAIAAAANAAGITSTQVNAGSPGTTYATTPRMTSAANASPSLVTPAGQGSQAPITIDLTLPAAASSSGLDLSTLFSGSTGTLLLVGGAAVLLMIMASK